MKKYLRISIIAAFLCSSFLGCNEWTLVSDRKDFDITIDGKDTEWQGRMAQVENIYLGICNDDEYLYVCLSATDKVAKAQMLGLFRQSFCLWFDPEGKKQRSFGLRISNESPFMNEALVDKLKFIDTAAFNVIANEMMGHMEIEVLRDNYPIAMLSETKGIDVAIGTAMNGRKLIFEFKIPLVKNENHPFAIDADAGKTIGVGLETSRIDMDLVWIKSAENDGEVRGSEAKSNGRYRLIARRSQYNEPYSDPIRYIDLWGKIQLAKADNRQTPN